MKLAILTQPLTNNYGGILQNYALQEILRRKGHEVVTLDISRPTVHFKFDLHTCLSICKRLLQKYILRDKSIVFVSAYKQTNWSNTPQKYQQRFIDEKIKLVKKGPNALKVQDDIYDGYIVGSDQVWRPCFSSGVLSTYYLDFVVNQNAKKIAYAVSFGVDYWESGKEETKKICYLANKFNAVSVREHSGIKLCKDYLKIQSVNVLDPTLLLDAKDYRALYTKYSEASSEGYIAVYVLDNSVRINKIINNVSTALHLPIKRIGTYNKTGFDSIECWLEGIDKAKYVITDSFHGCVFSIIFRKQFVALGNESRGMTRFNDLFSQFDLKERLVLSETFILSTLQKEINYEHVYEILDEKQKFSNNFLDNNLLNG